MTTALPAVPGTAQSVDPAALDTWAQHVAYDLYAVSDQVAKKISAAGARPPPQLAQVQQTTADLYHTWRPQLLSGQVSVADFDKAATQVHAVLQSAATDLRVKGIDPGGEILANLNAAKLKKAELGKTISGGIPGIGALIGCAAAVAALAYWGYGKVRSAGGFTGGGDDGDGDGDATEGQISDGEEDLGDSAGPDAEAEAEVSNPWGGGIERVKPAKPKPPKKKKKRAAKSEDAPALAGTDDDGTGGDGGDDDGESLRRDVSVVNVYEPAGTGKWHIEIADEESAAALEHDKITKRVLKRGVPSREEAEEIAARVFPQAEIQVAE